MIKSNLKLLAAVILCLLILYAYQGCDGIFPTASKPGIPADHNANYGGFLHIPIERNGGREADDCGECHGHDLRGQLYNYNGTLIVTSSCYQCHGNVWEEGGGGEGKKK